MPVIGLWSVPARCGYQPDCTHMQREPALQSCIVQTNPPRPTPYCARMFLGQAATTAAAAAADLLNHFFTCTLPRKPRMPLGHCALSPDLQAPFRQEATDRHNNPLERSGARTRVLQSCEVYCVYRVSVCAPASVYACVRVVALLHDALPHVGVILALIVCSLRPACPVTCVSADTALYRRESGLCIRGGSARPGYPESAGVPARLNRPVTPPPSSLFRSQYDRGC